MDNKRDYGRVPSVKMINCTYSLESKPEEKFEVGVKDLGPGGIQFESKEEIPVATILNMEITLPAATNDEPGKVRGRVAHCNWNERLKRYEIGVAYIRNK
jgi:hypothetical protein